MSRRFYVSMLAVTLLAGAGAWALCERLLSDLSGVLPAVAYVPICFCAVFAAAFLAVALCEAVMQRMGVVGWRTMLRGSERNFLLLFLAGLAATGVLAAGLEWLYEQGGEEAPAPERYIFVIDNSGSMTGEESYVGNDPDYLRFEVLDDCVAELDGSVSVALYIFGGEVYRMVGIDEATPASFVVPGEARRELNPTDIYNALMGVADEQQAAGTEKPARVILLTDGECDVLRAKVAETASRLSAVNATLCAVGFGSADERTLTRLAKSAGGAYFDAEDASGLARSLTAALDYSASRDLLGRRSGAETASVALTLLRIAAVMLLGAVMGAASRLATLEKLRAGRVVALALLRGLAAGAALELLLRFAPEEWQARLVMCLLLCAQLLTYAPRASSAAYMGGGAAGVDFDVVGAYDGFDAPDRRTR